jgi:uncharacterized protein (TIGR03382 family)
MERPLPGRAFVRTRGITIICALLASPALASAADNWSDPFPGVQRLHRTTSSQNINVLVVDLCAAGVRVETTASGERQRTASSFGGLVGAEAVINGDFFSFANYSTNGPAMSAGALWGGGDHGYVAPAQFGRNQVALPPHGRTGGVEAWAEEVVSGHPTLLAAGEVRGNNGDPLCTARHPRTALGFSADKSTLYLAVIDGRATGRAGMTCDEMIALFQELGAADAVNLDGGGSSTMWLQGSGVVNIPSDGSQRVTANHLAVHATGSGEAYNCRSPIYEASFADRDVPLEMTSGDEAVVWVELTNDGNVTWDLDLTRIGTQDPQDRDSPFFVEDNWIAPNRPTGADHSTYGPGSLARFTWMMRAPVLEYTTTFEETFQAVHEGVTWFGPTVTMEITVHPVGGPRPAPDDPEDDEAGGCAAAGGSGGALLALFALVAVRRRRRIGH